jgi:hypothetical protein
MLKSPTLLAFLDSSSASDLVLKQMKIESNFNDRLLYTFTRDTKLAPVADLIGTHDVRELPLVFIISNNGAIY